MSRALIAAAAFALAAPAAAQTAYFQTLEDVPLAPGLTEDTLAFDFESDQGRMVGAVARGPGAGGAVQDFYLAALPELGWSFVPVRAGERGQIRELQVQRGRETLTLAIGVAVGEVTLDVRFVARPASLNAD
jgi:hypothetical protein